ncbi:hypothetical protein G6F50_018729 [Rhizopus delemar]|uniref:Uncharacterized protein n=1 Tax=Rhizopus delemar TaxID=936053 RepID=A0A9P7BYL2_9FUNG|nr:hypothetical protein G6F50_018729 [Rhizopus delemar]
MAGLRQRTHPGGQHGGFAGAVGADHGHDTAGGHGQGGAHQRTHLAVAGRQVTDFQDGGLRRAHCTPPADTGLA